jgi:hypothetical protein
MGKHLSILIAVKMDVIDTLRLKGADVNYSLSSGGLNQLYTQINLERKRCVTNFERKRRPSWRHNSSLR